MAKSFFSRHYSQYKEKFLDYFAQDDQDNVLKILNKYKAINHEYYKILIKRYSNDYDHFNSSVHLTETEEKKISRLRANISKILKELKSGKSIEECFIRYQKVFNNFLDNFDGNDRIYAEKIIDSYSYFKNDYYEILTKKYGIYYDSLNPDVELTDNEEKTLVKFRKILKQKIGRIHAGDTLYEVLPKKYKLLVSSESYLELFPKKYKNLVIEIIEKYKNSEYYEILTKKYGTDYDCCDQNILLTEEEKNKLNYLTSNIKLEIREVKKNNTKCTIDDATSMYSFFDKQDYLIVTKILDAYKSIKHKYYQLVEKKFGEYYDTVNSEIELTNEERQQLRYFIRIMKEQIEKIKLGTSLEEILPYNEHHYYKSFLSFFDKNNQKKVIHILNRFQIDHPEYYQLVVKKFGEHYDTINLDVQLTDEEKKLLEFIRKEIQKKLKRKQPVKYNFKKSMDTLYKIYPKLKKEEKKNLIVLSCLIDKNMSVEEISSLTKLSLKTIDSIVISHLYLFDENVSKIVNEILERGYYSSSQIINIISLRGQIQYLNSLKLEVERLKKEKIKKKII